MPSWNRVADPPFDTLRWYREAELQHGRVAQLAIVGFLWPQIFGTFPSTAAYDYSELNPVDAFFKCPSLALIQITIFIGALEGRRYLRCIKGDAAPGDAGLGVPGGFNPLNLDYDDEEYAEL
jgi:light-harvesting complex I chlorophyll a/b binding protein 1